MKIENKEIPPHSLLPSTRNLAEKLSVSRSTIIKAYDFLILEGFIESKKGAGYWVSDRETYFSPHEEIDEEINYPELSKKGKSFQENVSLINSTSEKFVAFRPGLPPLDIFPVNQWKKLSNLYWRNIKSSALSYSDSSGIEALKKNIANYLNLIRGIKCDHHQVIIVSGSLQSLYLVGNALLNTGDTMVMENPTFPNVHSIFRSLQANIKALPIDDEGIMLDKLQLTEKEKPKLLHVTPSNHYPTGIQMSKKRKLEVLEWAHKNESIIIENDYDHEISNWRTKNESLFSLDHENRTVYLGTFNRLLHPSIRLGYMVVPYYLLEVIKALQKHSHRFVSPSNQVVMSQFIEKNHLYNHVKNVVSIAEERKEIFLKNFKEHFNENITIKPSQARSLHILAELPDTISDKEISNVFYHQNIIAHPYSKCFINTEKEGLIFGYSCVRNPVISKKINKMARIFNPKSEELLQH
ncbi:GntR family transcriptional regulator/MocR family aminotransferase [Mesonia maritima]|uniref:GntR family transcriptional regulator/MocR family aminotransferase n=2 Tax=Mesonia maritima TaxID=1793873 RepID=A0ABU1K8Y7_9FLAO|nr:GntR family transcriptional regulator/MocR family aminotransferase [Mesonia maritima]